MILVIGGLGQGKLEYVCQEYGFSSNNVSLGESSSIEEILKKPVLYGLHRLVERMLQEGRDPQDFLERLLRENPEVIIICDEIGCGVVPMEREARIFREETGRLCCFLASQAQRMVRVYCGIPTVLLEQKGE